MELALFLISLFLVVLGGKIFLDSSVSLSRIFKIPELIIGATIVSLATTTPELLISLFGSLTSHTQIAIGNILGTPIVNLGLIISLVLFFKKEDGQHLHRGKRRSLILYLLSLFLFILFMTTNPLTRIHGFILILIATFYLLYMINLGEHLKLHTNFKPTPGKIPIILKFILGALILVLGSRLLINTTVDIARIFQIPEYIIGLYLVALGTSIPELTTAIVSLIKHEENIAIGNLTGASILTLTLALGITTLITPVKITTRALDLDLPLIILLSILIILERFIPQIPKKLVALFLLTTYFVYLALIGK